MFDCLSFSASGSSLMIFLSGLSMWDWIKTPAKTTAPDSPSQPNSLETVQESSHDGNSLCQRNEKVAKKRNPRRVPGMKWGILTYFVDLLSAMTNLIVPCPTLIYSGSSMHLISLNLYLNIGCLGHIREHLIKCLLPIDMYLFCNATGTWKCHVWLGSNYC